MRWPSTAKAMREGAQFPAPGRVPRRPPRRTGWPRGLPPPPGRPGGRAGAAHPRSACAPAGCARPPATCVVLQRHHALAVVGTPTSAGRSRSCWTTHWSPRTRRRARPGPTAHRPACVVDQHAARRSAGRPQHLRFNCNRAYRHRLARRQHIYVMDTAAIGRKPAEAPTEPSAPPQGARRGDLVSGAPRSATCHSRWQRGRRP